VTVFFLLLIGADMFNHKNSNKAGKSTKRHSSKIILNSHVNVVLATGIA